MRITVYFKRIIILYNINKYKFNANNYFIILGIFIVVIIVCLELLIGLVILFVICKRISNLHIFTIDL